MAQVYDRVALIGLGLIASSLFWAIKRGGLAGEVTGYARSDETRATAREIGLCDRFCYSVAEAVAGADLVVLCVPVGVMGAVAAEIAPHRPACHPVPASPRLPAATGSSHPPPRATSTRSAICWRITRHQQAARWRLPVAPRTRVSSTRRKTSCHPSYGSAIKTSCGHRIFDASNIGWQIEC